MGWRGVWRVLAKTHLVQGLAQATGVGFVQAQLVKEAASPVAECDSSKWRGRLQLALSVGLWDWGACEPESERESGEIQTELGDG